MVHFRKIYVLYILELELLMHLCVHKFRAAAGMDELILIYTPSQPPAICYPDREGKSRGYNCRIQKLDSWIATASVLLQYPMGDIPLALEAYFSLHTTVDRYSN